MTGENLRKITPQLLLMFCMLKKKKYILHTFQKVTQSVKKSYLLIITSKHDGDFYCLSYLHSLRTNRKHESHKKL